MAKKQDVVSTRLPPKLSARFHSLCRKEEKAPAELVRDMVREGINRRTLKVHMVKRITPTRGTTAQPTAEPQQEPAEVAS